MVSQFGDVPANTRRIVELLRTTAAAGADWAVFPELCLQGAHTDNDRMELEAEPYKGGPAIAAIAAACRANSVACSVWRVQSEPKHPLVSFQSPQVPHGPCRGGTWRARPSS